jgi:hypothetical protein
MLCITVFYLAKVPCIFANFSFLDTFANLWKVTFSFDTSACMSLCPHRTTGLPLDGFSWNFIFEFFQKSFKKIQVSLKHDKNNRYFTCRPIYIFYQITSSNEMFKKKVVEKIKTHILYSVTCFQKLWDNVEKYGRGRQATVDNMVHAHYMLDI